MPPTRSGGSSPVLPAADEPTIATLAADWLAAYRQAQAEQARLDAASRAADRLVPPAPPGLATLRRPLWRHEAEAQELWQDQLDAIYSAFGVHGLEQAADQAFRAVAAVARRILALRPRNAAEAAIKFAVLLERVHDGQGGIDDARPVFAFLEDLERLAKAERELGRERRS